MDLQIRLADRIRFVAWEIARVITRGRRQDGLTLRPLSLRPHCPTEGSFLMELNRLVGHTMHLSNYE